MLGFVDEIKLEQGIVKDVNGFNLVCSGNIIWVTNYIKILEFSCDKCLLKIKNNVLKIEGVDITIKLLEKHELILKGKFNSITLENPYRGDENAR